MRPFIRRFAAFLSSWLVASTALPAAAMTTQQERDWGKDISREVVAEQGVLDDPLLSRWVNRIGHQLAAHSARRDVSYTFLVINSEEVNAFSVPGGYVFVDSGLLNFLHSDDELAAVLGHEIGHVERRHVVTLNEKQKALEIILDVAGLFAPGISRFGNLAGDLILFKLSRVAELQADQYGLMLMSQTGYDPQGMVAFLQRLQSIAPEHRSLLGRYFETHPALGDRVKHLEGYAALDRPSASELLARAIHDYDEGNYFVARGELGQVLALEPRNALALDYRRRVEPLFVAVPVRDPLFPARLRARADADIAAATVQAAAVKARLKLAKSELDEYERYLEHVGYYVDPQTRIGIARGNRLDRVLSGQTQVGQYMDHSYDEVSQTIAQAQDIADADATIVKTLRARMDRPDAAAPIGAALFAKTLGRAEAARDMALRATDAARGAMALGWQQGKLVSGFLDDFDKVSNYKGGDMQPADYRGLRQPLHAALVAAQKVARASDVASTLLNDAQALETLDEIDMTGPAASPARRRAFARVLEQRFGASAPDVAAASRVLPDAADLAAVAAISATTGSRLSATARMFRTGDKSAVAYADALGVRAETLQLELGLVWLAYGDGRTPTQ